MITSPRCGRPMTRYEAANGPMPEEPVCGLVWNHAGPCRSESSLARMRQQAATRGGAGSPALAAIIRETRTLAGLSQRDLARVLGVSQRTVTAWETADRRPGEAVLARVAEILAGAVRSAEWPLTREAAA